MLPATRAASLEKFRAARQNIINIPNIYQALKDEFRLFPTHVTYLEKNAYGYGQGLKEEIRSNPNATNSHEDIYNPLMWVGALTKAATSLPDNIDKGDYGQAGIDAAELFTGKVGGKVVGKVVGKVASKLGGKTATKAATNATSPLLLPAGRLPKPTPPSAPPAATATAAPVTAQNYSTTVAAKKARYAASKAYGGLIGEPAYPSMAGTYGPGVAESVRVMPRPVKTPDFGQNARDYVKSTQAERNSLIQSGANQPRLDSLTSNAFGALDQANIDIALGNYPRITNYENGGQMGDQQLSSSSFQVKGNPQTTDGNYYPEYNANLDHNEVVKNQFVFSDKLKHPATGQSFAKEAAGIESAIGKAQKTLKSNPNDKAAKNTVKLNEQRSKALAATQEAMASSMGLRAKNRNFVVGGYTGEEDNKPILPLNINNPYPFLTGIAGVDAGITNPSTPAPIKYANSSIRNSITGMPYYSGYTPSTTQSQQTVSPVPQLPPAAQTSPKVARRGGTKKVTAPVAPVAPVVPASMANFPMLNAANRTPTMGPVISGQVKAPNIAGQAIPQTAIAAGLNAGDQLNNKFTAGDYMQAAKVAAGFGQLIGGPVTEKPSYDTTRITQNVMDPRNALNQNQRSFKDATAGYDSPSVNARRAYENSMYANKMGQDANIITQYQQGNQQNRTAYEQAASNQRRYNVGQTLATNDLNQRNKDSYRQAVDSAFTGLSNFGMGLNEKKQGYDVLQILRQQYPEVYKNIYGAAGITTKKKKK